MPFTTIETVRKHLTDYRLGTKRIENEPLLLTGSGYVNLQYSNIEAGSERVKAMESIKPVREISNFTGDDTLNLSNEELVPDSVVAANNTSLGKIYIENIDFTVDYSGGVLTRIVSGDIPGESEVAVWYRNYRLYTKGIDYSIDYVAGKIGRISSGNIEAGQSLYIDYISQYGNITEESIKNAIVEASGKVLAIIDPSYESETHQALTTAETYLTIAVICRIKAIEAAGRPDYYSAGYSGDFWLKLRDSYTQEGLKMLEKFTPKRIFLSPPRLTSRK
ncbi:MAG: hypothetical protein GF307_11760 [candidate division Zixibacteria bacterium]|nr:hypothetical protein [candidate division Zixibacteria bacterium]